MEAVDLPRPNRFANRQEPGQARERLGRMEATQARIRAFAAAHAGDP